MKTIFVNHAADIMDAMGQISKSTKVFVTTCNAIIPSVWSKHLKRMDAEKKKNFHLRISWLEGHCYWCGETAGDYVNMIVTYGIRVYKSFERVHIMRTLEPMMNTEGEFWCHPDDIDAEDIMRRENMVASTALMRLHHSQVK